MISNRYTMKIYFMINLTVLI
ncbi:hypothetical protein Zm00014a_025212 [Zea mays]|uniref:Uncharacterized protein n=1 Tax=Zea mays TaxID=4577 RepID=A0A3L6FAQ0_MAIZE|nr:hypothetical protein Zm00014a_025212 [Zea mays]